MLGQPRPVLLWMRGQRIVLGGEFVTWGHPVFSGQEQPCRTRKHGSVTHVTQTVVCNTTLSSLCLRLNLALQISWWVSFSAWKFGWHCSVPWGPVDGWIYVNTGAHHRPVIWLICSREYEIWNKWVRKQGWKETNNSCSIKMYIACNSFSPCFIKGRKEGGW